MSSSFPPHTPEEWAYLAGFLDGEAYFGAHEKDQSLRIVVNQVDEGVLRWIHLTFGGNIGFRRGSGNARDQWTWRSSDRQFVAYILRNVEPFLRVKKRQALLMLRFCAAVERYPRQPKHPERRIAFKAMKGMNARGRTTGT